MNNLLAAIHSHLTASDNHRVVANLPARRITFALEHAGMFSAKDGDEAVYIRAGKTQIRCTEKWFTFTTA